MKGLWGLVIVSLFLMSFISAGITSKAIANNSNDKSNNPAVISSNEEEAAIMNQGEESNLKNQIRNRLNESQIRKVITEKNRLRVRNQTEEHE